MEWPICKVGENTRSLGTLGLFKAIKYNKHVNTSEKSVSWHKTTSKEDSRRRDGKKRTPRQTDINIQRLD